MTALTIVLLALPAVVALSFATAWATTAWISRTCDCDFCEQTQEDM